MLVVSCGLKVVGSVWWWFLWMMVFAGEFVCWLVVVVCGSGGLWVVVVNGER